jgi:hypothetical protein
MRVDDALALPRVVEPFCEQFAGRRENRGDRVDRRRAGGRIGDTLHEQPRELGAASEQHLTFVRIVPEKRPLREAGPGGDLRDSRLLEPALAEELHCRALEARTSLRLPSAHEFQYT